MREAMFWTADGKGGGVCGLCRFHCHIGKGKRGRCGVRENRDGVLYSLNYGLAVANYVDPIEKKPFFHVYPGTKSYSIAAMGCNFRCLHCQNYSISQVDSTVEVIAGVPLSPQQVVDEALAAGCQSIAYTYSEPTVFFEYVYETAQLARAAGLANLFVSNGYIAKEPLRLLAPLLDAANIDLKGFSADFYRKVCGGDLEQVLESILCYREFGVWLELTTLLIPDHNDDEAELKALAAFIVENLGEDTPWHVTGFYPTYRLTDVPPTPVETLLKAQQLGFDAGLNYVYIGNTHKDGGENTFCSSCGQRVIVRRGFDVVLNRAPNGHCLNCGTIIAGVGMEQLN
ncbi:MAG: AmmeMemoRadiSam system radical SAM enzyme [Deltaproteobacteria bacterium]|nr:AmmeMemoRadiSam system radical SAM enzyme [Deltaproteobacteria bacterium]